MKISPSSQTFGEAISSQPITVRFEAPMALWHMDGDWRDASGNGNNGTPYNGATFNTNSKMGATAGSFDGIDDYVLIGDPVPASLQIQNEISLEAWIYVTAYPSSLGLIVGSQYDPNHSGATILLDGRTNPDGQPAPPGHIHFQIGDGSWHTTNANARVPLNQWVHIAATRRANEDAKIYYNGVLQPSTSVSWSGSISYNGSWFAIGRQKDMGRYFPGLIDEVAVYSRALSAEEIKRHYDPNFVEAPTVNPLPAITSSRTITLSGTKPAGTSIKVNGTQAAQLDNAATWQGSYALQSGVNTLNVIAADSSGNQSLPVVVTITLDDMPPVIVRSMPANGETLNSPPFMVQLNIWDEFSFIDFDASMSGASVVNALGQAIPGFWYPTVVEFPGAPPPLPPGFFSAGSGALVFIFSGPSPDGVYTLTVNPTDVLGNTTTASIVFAVDTSAPPAPVINPVISPTNQQTQVISGTKTEDAVSIFFSASVRVERIYYPTSTTWSATVSGLTEGQNTFTVYARDAAGNTSAAAEAVIVYDSLAPAPPTVNPVSPTRDSSVVLTGTKEAGMAIAINGVLKVAGDSSTAWTCSYQLSEGQNNLSITARDAVGNSSAAANLTIIRDTTPPLFTVDTFKSPTASTTETISGRKEAGCTVNMNGTRIFGPEDMNASWSYTVGLTAGAANSFVFTAADSLGNTTTRTIEIINDNTPPVPLASGVLKADGRGKGTEITLSWNTYVEASDLDSYRIYISSSDFADIAGMQAAGTTAKGTRTYKATGLIRGNAYYFAVVPVDTSGNLDPGVNTASAVATDILAPEDVTITSVSAGYDSATGNYITVNWTPSADTSGDLAEQFLYVDGGAGYDAGVPIGKTLSTYSKSGLLDATKYKLKITVKDTGGLESAGAVTEGVTRLNNPTGLAANASDTKVTLSWNTVASPYLRQYNIYRLASSSPQSDAKAMAAVGSVTSNAFTDTAVTNGTVYQYAVTTLNTSGAERTDVVSVAASPKIDDKGPMITVFNLIHGQVVAFPMTINATATDNDSGMDRLELFMDGTLLRSQTGGSISYFWNVDTAPEGSHTVKVKAYDQRGNVTEDSRQVIVSHAHVINIGQVAKVDADGDYLYTAHGSSSPYLSVYSLEDPLNPVLLSTYGTGNISAFDAEGSIGIGLTGSNSISTLSHTGQGFTKLADISLPRGAIKGIDLRGQYAFYSSGLDGWGIAEVSSGGGLSDMGAVRSGYSTNRLISGGGYLYAADGTGGLRIYTLDSLNSESPVISITSPQTGTSVLKSSEVEVKAEVTNGVSVSVVFLVDGKELFTDKSAPYSYRFRAPNQVTALTLKARACSLTGGCAGSSEVALNIVESEAGSGMPVLAVNLKSKPDAKMADIPQQSLKTSGKAFGMDIGGFNAYVMSESGLNIYDISNSKKPIRVGSLEGFGAESTIIVDGDFGYVSDSGYGLQVIDISRPEEPKIISSLMSDETPGALNKVGDYIYMANGSSGLRIIDITDPYVPLDAGVTELDEEALDIDIVDDAAYVTTGSGVKAYDISMPWEPIFDDEILIKGVRKAAVDGKGNIAGAIVMDDEGRQKLYLIDIGNRRSPGIVATLTMGKLPLIDIDVKDGKVFLTEETGGTIVLDVSDPALPSVTGIHKNTFAKGVRAGRQVFYEADSSVGLRMVRAGKSKKSGGD
ncbi:MAG: hypothetical protein HZB33_14665 [Nitrospirae bacterium]|nr:hypothetical protein [Nitrospirota bacterium]